MRRTSVARLVLVAVLGAVAVLAVLRFVESRGATILPVPLLSVAVLALIALVVLAMGWQVRQFREGRRPGFDPLVAARTVVLATASAYTGALLTGWYGGHVLLVLGDLDIAARRAVATSAGAALLGALLLVVAGLVTERWCEIRQGDDDEKGGGGASSTAPA